MAQRMQNMMKANDMKRWLKDNWLALLVGLVLPSILAVLWRSPLHTLQQFTPHALARVGLIFIIMCCVLSGALIYFVVQLRRVKAFVNQNFYPHGTYRSLDEEMPINAEFTRGWNEATEQDKTE